MIYETIGESTKEEELILPKITIRNDRTITGNVKVISKGGAIVISLPFDKRSSRREITDLFNQVYWDKIQNRGWYISITLD